MQQIKRRLYNYLNCRLYYNIKLFSITLLYKGKLQNKSSLIYLFFLYTFFLMIMMIININRLNYLSDLF